MLYYVLSAMCPECYAYVRCVERRKDDILLDTTIDRQSRLERLSVILCRGAAAHDM